MLTKSEFKDVVSEELRVLRFLGGKVDASKMSWRPSPGQRSIQETMAYLSFCGIGPARAIMTDDWSGIGALAEASAGVDKEGFLKAIDSQETELHALFDSIPDGDLENRQVELPWGKKASLGEALNATTSRFLTAYRMQLFLFLKASGQEGLGFHEAWLGMDKPAS